MPGAGKYQLVVSSLNAEAVKWRRLSDNMATVKGNADRLNLDWSAFFFMDVVSTSAHSRAYDNFQEWMVALLQGGSIEFAEMAAALDKAAALYEQSDQQAATDMSQIYGTQK